MENIEPNVGSAVFVINEDGKFLIGKRESDFGNGTWCLPGGWLEEGESIEDCGTRETLEETNVNIKVIEILGKINTVSGDIHHETVFMTGEYVSGTVLPQKDEFSEVNWVKIDELPENLFHIFKEFLKQNSELVDTIFNHQESGKI